VPQAGDGLVLVQLAEHVEVAGGGRQDFDDQERRVGRGRVVVEAAAIDTGIRAADIAGGDADAVSAVTCRQVCPRGALNSMP
jgi:hypothetical protein